MGDQTMTEDNFIRNFITQKTSSVIRKVGNEFCIFSKTGKKIGCFTSRKKALKRLREIEFFSKNKDEE